MQAHPNKYLHKMLKNSRERIKELRAGGIKPPPSEVSALTHHCFEFENTQDVMSNYIEVQEKIRAIKDQQDNFHPLDIIVEKHRDKGLAYCMKLMGYVLYFAHTWIDNIYLTKHNKCNHSYFCTCKKKLLEDRKIDRPFLETPIRGP